MSTAELAEFLATALDRDLDGAEVDGEVRAVNYGSVFGAEINGRVYKIQVTEIPF